MAQIPCQSVPCLRIIPASKSRAEQYWTCPVFFPRKPYGANVLLTLIQNALDASEDLIG